MLPIRALLSNLIDYAGLYSPASLPLDEVVANFERYRQSPESWMLNRLVLPASSLTQVKPATNWRVTMIADEEPFELPDYVESVETKDLRSFTKPVYRELPLEEIEDGFAKIRTASIRSLDLAEFLLAAAARRLPFKATAGLHHPIRSEQTGMHGFLNLFIAAAFAWNKAGLELILDLLDETDATAFTFSAGAMSWRDRRLTTAQILESRRSFAHSFGSCSFEEPVDDLKQLGFL